MVETLLPQGRIETANLKAEHYTQLISVEDYIRVIFDEHIYIKAAVDRLVQCIEDIVLTSEVADPMEVVELGCGPGVILHFLRDSLPIHRTGVDIDPVFLAAAKRSLSQRGVKFSQTSIEAYQHPKPVSIFFSSGVHHHMAKGQQTEQYLKNVYQQLVPGGCYIMNDEFLPDYSSAEEREVKLVIWHAHVIANALAKGFDFLATEEAKILLDDMMEGRCGSGSKAQQQLSLICDSVTAIDDAARHGDFARAEELSITLLVQLDSGFRDKPLGNVLLDASRGDYKVCDRVFREEAAAAGFRVRDTIQVGPVDTIGGMGLYVLEK